MSIINTDCFIVRADGIYEFDGSKLVTNVRYEEREAYMNGVREYNDLGVGRLWMEEYAIYSPDGKIVKQLGGGLTHSVWASPEVNDLRPFWSNVSLPSNMMRLKRYC